MHLRLFLRGQDQALLVGRSGELLLAHLHQTRQERLLFAFGRQPRVHAPVLHGDEGLDLAFAIHDQAERDGLDAAG